MRWPIFGRYVQVMTRRLQTVCRAEEPSVPPQDSTAGELDVVVALVSNADDDAHFIPSLGDGILKSDISSDLEWCQTPGRRVVVLLAL